MSRRVIDYFLDRRPSSAACLSVGGSALSVAASASNSAESTAIVFGLSSFLSDASSKTNSKTVVDLLRQPLPRNCERRVVGRLLAERNPQELAKGEAVGAAQVEAALAVDAFEEADEDHAEVDALRQAAAAGFAHAPRRVFLKTC